MTTLATTPACARRTHGAQVGPGGQPGGRRLAIANGLAGVLGNVALYGVPLDETEFATPPAWRRVTPGQVQYFASRVMDPAKASVIIAGDAKTFAAALKAKQPGLEVIPVDQLDPTR